jgi:hypothetical protein
LRLKRSRKKEEKKEKERRRKKKKKEMTDNSCNATERRGRYRYGRPGES